VTLPLAALRATRALRSIAGITPESSEEGIEESPGDEAAGARLCGPFAWPIPSPIAGANRRAIVNRSGMEPEGRSRVEAWAEPRQRPIDDPTTTGPGRRALGTKGTLEGP
jgi:hypothetical protein